MLEIESNITLSSGTPIGEKEVALAKIWASLLNVELSKIGRSTSFFEIGGDSISAMQLVAKCRSVGWKVSNKLIFKLSTLKRIAASLESSVLVSLDQEEVNGSLPLTPIQRLFFGLNNNDSSHFNQSMLLKPCTLLNAEKMQEVLNVLATHHDLLRAHYVKGSDGTWEQTIWPVKEFVHPLLSTETVDSASEMEKCIWGLQSALDIENGPLYASSLITLEGEQFFFLTFHHLIIDLVSWRVLLEDIETLVLGERLPPKTTSFKKWSENLNEKIERGVSWSFEPVDNTVQRSGENSNENSNGGFFMSMNLSAETTFKLDRANVAFRTNIQDLILAAFANALYEVDTHAKSFRIFVEGHGREPWDEDLDVGRTVGWFTAMFPVLIPVQGNRVSQLRATKEALRSIPDKGITYGMPSESFQNESTLAFNYLGRFQGLESAASYFSSSKLDLDLAEVSSSSKSFTDGLITARHIGDQLVIDFKVEKGASPLVLQQWLERALVSLDTLVQTLVDDCQLGGLFASDFSLLPVAFDMSELESSVTKMKIPFSKVEDIFPVTGLQAGLLHGILSDPSAYCVQKVWELENVDLNALQDAWKKVAAEHAILRTSFATLSTGIVQIVLEDDFTPWTEVGMLDRGSSSLADFLKQDRLEGFSFGKIPFSRFSYSRDSGN